MKLNLRLSQVAVLAVLMTIVLVAVTGVTPATAFPQIPHTFYGVAYVDNNAAAGNVVYAKSSTGTVYTQCTTIASTTQNYRLQVPAFSTDPDQAGAVEGETIYFYIGTRLANTAIFHIGGVNGNVGSPIPPFNLYVATTTFSVSANTTSSITSSSATLNATLNGVGTNPSVNLTFEYGLTTSYGTIVTATPSSLTAAGTFSTAITGLSSSTTYYFKAVATGSTVQSAAGSFATLAPTLTVATGTATGLTQTSATLVGALSDLGGFSSASVLFNWGTSPSTLTNSTTPQLKSSIGSYNDVITGLSSGTQYYFQAKAISGTTTALSTAVAFTTQSATVGCTTDCCHRFWGTAYSTTGRVANAAIIAYANSVQKATITADSNGNYNIYVPVTSGATVTFTVNGTPAAESIMGVCMGVNNNTNQPYNLHVTITGDLTISTTSLADGAVGVVYTSQTLAATGGTLPYTWSLTPGSSLPTGLSLSSAGVISGTPSTAGTTSFIVTVYDSASHNNSKTLSITIATMAITTTTLPNGTLGVAYTPQTLGVSGGTSPYTWTVSSGALPTSLSLASGTGIISGTPSVAGAFSFTARVADSASHTATKPLTINIAGAPGSLTIGTASPLPTGTVGSAYPSQTMTATGGTGTGYVWVLNSGALPTGLTLSGGVISGTPTVAATSTFNIKVTDSGSNTTNKDFQLTISGGSTGTEILGSTAGTTTTNLGGNTMWLYKCQATGTNTIANMNVRVTWPGRVKVAIYAVDSVGDVGSLIVANNTATAVTNTSSSPPIDKVNPVPLTTSITAGQYYWLAVVANDAIVSGAGGSGPRRYQIMTTSFDGFTFPTSISGYMTSYSGSLFIAGAY